MLLYHDTGAWGGQLVDVLRKESQRPAALAELPVQPKKRYIFNIHCDKKQMTPKPSYDSDHNINIMEEYEYGMPPPPDNTPLVIEPSEVHKKINSISNIIESYYDQLLSRQIHNL